MPPPLPLVLLTEASISNEPRVSSILNSPCVYQFRHLKIKRAEHSLNVFNFLHVTPPYARGRDQVHVKTPQGQLTPTEGGGCRVLVPLSHLKEDRDATTRGRGKSS